MEIGFEKNLDKQQPRERADFKKLFSTLGYIHPQTDPWKMKWIQLTLMPSLY